VFARDLLHERVPGGVTNAARTRAMTAGWHDVPCAMRGGGTAGALIR